MEYNQNQPEYNQNQPEYNQNQPEYNQIQLLLLLNHIISVHIDGGLSGGSHVRRLWSSTELALITVSRPGSHQPVEVSE